MIWVIIPRDCHFDPISEIFGAVNATDHTTPRPTSQFEHNFTIASVPNTFQAKQIIAAQASRNLNFKSTAGCSLKVALALFRVLIETLDD